MMLIQSKVYIIAAAAKLIKADIREMEVSKTYDPTSEDICISEEESKWVYQNH